MKLVLKYRAICTVQVKEGDTTLFWSDVWGDKVPQFKYPRLFSFAIDANMSVKDVVLTQDRTTLFHLP